MITPIPPSRKVLPISPANATRDPTDQHAPPSMMELLERGEQEEAEAARELLELSRPVLLGKRTLRWDGFIKFFAGGLDQMLWRWFGADVEVARAREQQALRRSATKAPAIKGPSSSADRSDVPPPQS